MRETRVKTQRWSDGLVCFSNLADEIMCQINGLFWLIELAGTMCFLGLASGFPVRGGLDAAWAIELYPNELYGAAVARAYELESEVAGYPRIVVGERIVEFIHTHLANPNTDIYSANNRALAETCKAMLAKDTDGYWIVDYLGKGFRESVTKGQHQELYVKAREFVEQQLKEHNAAGNAKLVGRYTHILEYFIAHQNVGLEGGSENGTIEGGTNV